MTLINVHTIRKNVEHLKFGKQRNNNTDGNIYVNILQNRRKTDIINSYAIYNAQIINYQTTEYMGYQ